MPYKDLPPAIRVLPEVQDAWHHRHEERLTALESPQSKSDTGHRLDPVTLRLLILGMCMLTASGIIKPEALLKMLPLVLKLAFGG